MMGRRARNFMESRAAFSRPGAGRGAFSLCLLSYTGFVKNH